MKRKTRPEARMMRLSAEQQDAAFAHCQTVSLREGVCWLKEKFKLSINRNSLGNWLREERVARSMTKEISEIRDHQVGASLVNDTGGPTRLTVANSVLFSSAVFKEFLKPEGERNENRLFRYMILALKARELEIRASGVQLSFERFRFDTAKRADGCGGESQTSGEADANERAKIEKAMLLLYGEPPIGFTSEAGLPVAQVAQPEWQNARSSGRTERQ
jgi:hypothetical protein